MATVEVDRGDENPEWDAFVAAAPGGHHLQMTGWAHVKALAGWRATRLLVRSGDEVVGGCQMLIRDLPLSRRVAYVPRGPLLASRDPEVQDALLTAMGDVARKDRVLMMKVQPPVDRDDMPALLRRRGFAPSELQTAPAASVRVELAGRDDAQLLQAMSSSVRRNVRAALKRGVTARPGTAADLALLQDLLAATGERQGFTPYSAEYYERLWDAFAPAGHAQLVIVEHEGAPASAMLLITVGDTAIDKIAAWGGRSVPGANELMHYSAMCSARDRGFRYYDFEGIPVDVARSVLAGGPAPESGVAVFKLRFGGDVVLYPGAHDAFFGRLLGPAARRLAPRAERSRKLAHRMAGRTA
jgi:lipid II:glycine glycyltransferase (peptidoglycan interpeptide bridge formation enzyme)